ncbi:DEAD/DEAH box helicase [Vreelandella alkaliphila]|uniref:DEAD/DEAH box helicase n=1 Tax=Vreelandella alkaliphila TaxID=272774 RepID=A0AAJ2S566_9GAMM|nr:DEAD/DEAH box helicase [Halomonas alkaliphila]MDX5979580.1 DEAD/DEAH box helicase [Halomonas alkaliphila]
MSHFYAMTIPVETDDESPNWAHLRGYQQSTVNGVRAAFRQKFKAPLLVLPAGGGKTFTSCYMIDQAVAKKRNVLILVHRSELADQFSAALTTYGVKHGLIAAGVRPDFAHRVQVASVQTYAKRMHTMIWQPHLIISDEAHHVTEGSQWGRVIEHHPGSLKMGLTATPIRLDGKGLGIGHGGYFDAIVEGPSPADLMEWGNLCDYRMFAPTGGKKVDMTGVGKVGGDYNKKEASERINKPTITGNAIEHYREHAHQRPAVVFCMNRRHAEDVCARFCDAGYKFAVLDGTLRGKGKDADGRDLVAQRVAALSSGDLHGLVTVDLVSEGFDLPAIEVAISLRATQSEALWIQQIARALRPAKGKEYAVILDHVGNSERHGLPDDEREWSLEGKKKGKKGGGATVSPIKQCEACGHVHRPGPPQCPECLEPYETKQREVEETEGKLQEVERKRSEKRQKEADIKAAKSLPELQFVAQKYGYDPKWAHVKWKQKLAADQGKYRSGRPSSWQRMPALPPAPPVEVYDQDIGAKR